MIDINLILNIAYIVVGILFGILLISASHQDFETQMLTMKTAIAFMVISVASFIIHQTWIALAGYVIFFIISYFLYDYRVIQVLAGGIMFALGIYILPVYAGIPIEDAGMLSTMGILWAIAFMMPQRGESDYNVLYTTLAFMGTIGFSWFIVVSILAYFVTVIFQLFLNKKNMKLIEWMYSVYFRFVDPSRRDKEPIVVQYRGNQVLLPMIPFLHMTLLISLFVSGIITNQPSQIIVGSVSLMALIVVMIKQRTTFSLKTKEVS